MLPSVSGVSGLGAAAVKHAWTPLLGRLLRPRGGAASASPRHPLSTSHGFPGSPGSPGGGGGGNSGRGRRITAQGDSGGGAGGDKGDGGLWGAYNRALERSPLLTKAITTAVISAFGNVFCQLVVEAKPSLDTRRLAIFTGLGFAWVAPALHTWFAFVNKIVPYTGNKGAIVRMLLDQGAWAPVFIASMIALITAIDGGDPVKALRNDWASSIRANWVLWVPAQFLNFRFIPPQHQLLFANVTSLIWNVWFSFLTRPKTA